MKTEPNEPANPIHYVTKGAAKNYGLTKLEFFAAMSLQGVRANSNLMLDASEAAKQACNDAYALINELNK